jgi:hypothetical protein
MSPNELHLFAGVDMKNKIIAGLVLFIAGMLIGFVPQYMKLTDAEHQLDVSRRADAINDFRNRFALLYFETARNNFSSGLTMASKEFSDMRVFVDQTSDPNLKTAIGDVLNSRDSVIAGLAKGDSAVGAQIQTLFMKMQKIE